MFAFARPTIILCVTAAALLNFVLIPVSSGSLKNLYDDVIGLEELLSSLREANRESYRADSQLVSPADHHGYGRKKQEQEDIPEEELLNRLRSLDEEGLEEFVDRYVDEYLQRETNNAAVPPTGDQEGGVTQAPTNGLQPPTGAGTEPAGPTDTAPNPAPTPGKNFYITSQLNGYVVEISLLVPLEGAKIRMWKKRKSSDLNQQWILNADGYIVSALNQSMEFTDSEPSTPPSAGRRYSFDILSLLESEIYSDRFGDLSGLEMHAVADNYKGGRWKWNSGKDQMVVNQVGRVLTILDASTKPGALLIQHTDEPEPHKLWKLDYVK